MQIDALFESFENQKEEIAIIGIDCTFGAYSGLSEVLELIKGNKTAFSEIPERRKQLADLSYQTRKKNYTPIAYMEYIDSFDYEFFNIPKLEARLMDPRQRLFLQSSWRAIEDSGYSVLDIQQTNMGVFLGLANDGGNDYFQLIKSYEPEMVGIATAGNIQSMIASRISYLLNLSGPALVVDTACSSSMVALHTACQSILNGDCDSAIVGGVNLKVLPKVDEENLVNIGNTSKDYQVRTFDDQASGTNSGEGVAAIVVKKLSEAIQDHDHIYAVIKSSAINQDGKSNGITAPNGAAQEAVISKAWEAAGVQSEDFSFLEAHGTGTKLGDPIEFEALSNVSRRYSSQKNFLPISAFKSNIGHLDSLSGLAGIVKAVLCIKNHLIPAGRNFVSPNSSIDFLNSPLYVNTKVKAYEGNQEMIAGISSFGLSGTNTHVVLEGYKSDEVPNSKSLESYPFIFSAVSEESLIHYLNKFKKFVEKTELTLSDLSYTLNSSRRQCKYRISFTADNLDVLNQKLNLILNRGLNQFEEEGIFYGRINNIKGSLTEYLNEFKYLATQVDKSWTPLQIAKEFGQCNYLDFKAYYSNTDYKKESIPVYDFLESHLWVDMPLLQDEFSHPIIGREVQRTDKEIVYRNTLSKDSHWILAEHQIKGVSVVPGTAYVDAAFVVGRQEFKDLSSFSVEKVNFYSLLEITGVQLKEVESHFAKTEVGFRVTIFSRNKGDKNWQKNIELNLRVSDNSVPKHYHIPELIQTMKKKYILTKGDYDIGVGSSNSLFEEEVFNEERARKSIIKLGKHWDTSLEAYSRPDAVLCRLGLSGALQFECTQHLFHPSLMDCAVNSGTFMNGRGFYLPYYYKNIQLFRAIPNEFYVYIHLKDTPSKELQKFDIQVISIEGEVICEISDYIVKRVNEETNNLYTIDWKLTNLSQTAALENISYLILGDSDSQLVTRLAELSHSVTLIEDSHDFEKMKKKMENWLGSPGNHHVILSFGVSQSLKDIKNFYQAIQFIAQLRLKANKFRLSIIIRRGDLVNEDQSRVNAYENMKSGMGKVLAKEVFSNNIQLIDIDEETDLKLLTDELSGQEGAYYVAFRGNKRYQQVLRPLETPQKSYKIKKGVYLITGGLGGIGQQLVKSLVSSGSIIIAVGKRSAETRIGLITEFKRLANKENSEFIYYQVDVTKKSEVRDVLKEIKNLYGDLTGVFHAAGVAVGGYIHSLSYQQYLKDVSVKVEGANNLYEFTQSSQLDFFVNFSSVNSLIGAIGQVDYVSANAYLDVFPYTCKKNGRVSTTKYLTINWSGWLQTGLTEGERERHDKGFKDLIPEQAIYEMYLAMSTDKKRIVIGEIDPKSSKAFSRMKGISISADILAKMKKSDRPHLLVEGSSANDLGEKGSNSKNQEEVEKKVKEVWEKIFDFDVIDRNSKFSELGGDSILAAYLLKELDKYFPDVLDISDIYSYPTVSSIANYIWSVIHKNTENEEQEDKKSPQVEFTNWDTLLESLQSGTIKVDDIRNTRRD
ncbi:SDR family NAD(P)-dependent oxidoreductase [Streptococcus mutans]|nr:SDR family NAD(P)-dependent oxidoreductase [Streptococcus mutans]